MMLLIDLGDHDWGHGALALESSLLGGLIISNLRADGSGELGRANESHDVGVVLEDEDLLVGGGFIIDGRSNLDNGSSLQVWELDLEGKGVESLTREISKLKLVGVVIELENLENLGNDIEVLTFLGGRLQLGDSAVNVVENVGGSEELVGPELESRLDGGVLSLLSVLLSGVGIWGITGGLSEWGNLIGGVKGPG